MKKVIFFILIILFCLASMDVLAAYPTKGVTLICPWSPGGGTDMVARILASELEKEYGVPFSVVNKPGGGGAVGHGAGAYAKPDGYTITLSTLEIATMHSMGLTQLTYEDFDYVMQVNEDPAAVIVRSDALWDSVTELVVDIAMHPGEYKFSGTGAGGIWDLARIGLLDSLGIPADSVLWIPTQGSGPAIVELLGGHVDVLTCSAPIADSQLEGEFKLLAVMSDTRDQKYPDIPTLKELGINWSAGTWRGITVPKGTPKEIIDSLYEKLSKIVASSEYKDLMKKAGFGIKVRDPEEFYNFAKEQDSTWRSMLDKGGYLKK